MGDTAAGHHTRPSKAWRGVGRHGVAAVRLGKEFLKCQSIDHHGMCGARFGNVSGSAMVDNVSAVALPSRYAHVT